jgi:predicted transcriptional regulator YheO
VNLIYWINVLRSNRLRYPEILRSGSGRVGDAHWFPLRNRAAFTSGSKCSAIRIANGEHTGRKIGSPITDLALRMLHDMTGADSSVSKCYFTRAKSGVLMKSVTIAIRNRDQRVIGLLCINIDLDVPFSQIMNTFIPPETPEVGSAVNFASSVEDLVTQTLEFTIEEVNADRNVSNNAKNRQIVLNLYEKGIFDIKDAINQVADRLNISKHTVYLYIRQFKNGDFLGQDK